MENLFLSGSSVKRIEDFDICLDIVLLHDLWFTKLLQGNQSCKTQIKSDQRRVMPILGVDFQAVDREKQILTRTLGGPHSVARFINGVRFDVDDVEDVSLVGQIIYRPLKSKLAALGEVHGHTNLPISRHFVPIPAMQKSETNNH